MVWVTTPRRYGFSLLFRPYTPGTRPPGSVTKPPRPEILEHMADQRRVLIIDQMGVVESECARYTELAKYPDIDLRLVVPKYWRWGGRTFTFCGSDQASGYQVSGFKVIFPGYSHRSFYTEGLRKVVFQFEPQIIHVFQEPWSLFAFQAAYLKNRYAPEARFGFLTWENHAVDHTNLRMAFLHERVERYVLDTADFATPVTENALRILGEKGFQGRTEVILWGINEALFGRLNKKAKQILRRQFGIESSQVVGYVGRLVEEKGVLDLVQAVSAIPGSVSILLVGNGPLESEIRHRCKNLPADHLLIIHPAVPTGQVANYMNVMDVLVLPSKTTSHWTEQFGRVLAEAMACGTPVVGSNSGEIPTVIGDAGLLFEEGDVPKLADTLQRVLNDRNLRETLIRRGLRRVTTHFTSAAFARRLHDLYVSDPR